MRIDQRKREVLKAQIAVSPSAARVPVSDGRNGVIRAKMTIVLVTLTLLLIAALASAEKLPSSGGRADSVSATRTELETAARAVADPSADYYKRLAAKRLRLLSAREHRIVALLERLRGESRRKHASSVTDGSPRSIICSVFGAHCSEALRVAWCESRLNVYARNGQYLGIFQEGEYARARYGFGWTVLAQARSAYRYFLDAGWSPWACKP